MSNKTNAAYHPYAGIEEAARGQAAAYAMRNPKPSQIRYGEDLEEWVDRVMPDALAAADESDREHGTYRVKLSVEKVARLLMRDAYKERGESGGLIADYFPRARDIIVALNAKP